MSVNVQIMLLKSLSIYKSAYVYHILVPIFINLTLGIPPKPAVKMQPSQLINLTVNNFVLSMKCTFYADGFEYIWEKKNEKNIPRAQDINARQLTITNLKTEDSGEYQCIISNSTGVIMSDYSLLTVQG